MNSKPIPVYPRAEIVKSVVAFMGENPDGATLEQVYFSVQSDALASGYRAPTDGDVREVAINFKEYRLKDCLFHTNPPQSDDWQFQRIPCDVVDKMRRVLIETISVCAHTTKPTLGGVDLVESLEALRIKEK